MLPVILWSPIEQYTQYIRNECPKCRMEGLSSVLVASGWNSGHSADHQPRLIHCLESNVILVSRVYHCCKGHTVFGHHPGILEAFKVANIQSLVPFQLWHIAGFTQTMIENIDHMIQLGIHMQQLESVFVEKRTRMFYTLKERYQQIQPEGVFPDLDHDSVHFWRASPTRHAIGAIFLQRFWQRESVYNHRMSLTSMSSENAWLSCDHTFRSVANVGIVRRADQHWVKQYSGLFCILNSDGVVVTWKMTKTLTFDEIENHLTCLQTRLQQHGRVVQEFYVDICCSWRKKLTTIFGQQLKVYLDIFHAVQRISRKLPKKHPYHSQCLKALQLMFRDQSDQGPIRTKSTPDSATLRRNLLTFQQQWEGISYNDRPIISPATVKEIRSLLVHIDKGCLSGIQPGRGTNRNERLHKDLNSHMTTSRYGVELAYALLTSIFYSHNEKITANKEKRAPKPISAYTIPGVSSEIHTFGLSSMLSCTTEYNPEQEVPPSKTLMAKLQYKDVKEEIEFLECVALTQEVEAAVGVEHIPLNMDITNDEALSILQQAVSAFYVSLHLQAMSKTAYINDRDVFFMSFMALMEGYCSSSKSSGQVHGNLEGVLRSWNFQLVPVPGDGNCLFTAVSLGLIHCIQGGDNLVVERLTALGIPTANLQDMHYIQRELRERMVKEWLEKSSFYQGFVTTNITTVAHNFLQSGTFSGCWRFDGIHSS